MITGYESKESTGRRRRPRGNGPRNHGLWALRDTVFDALRLGRAWVVELIPARENEATRGFDRERQASPLTISESTAYEASVKCRDFRGGLEA
jgi:hypothetical protein